MPPVPSTPTLARRAVTALLRSPAADVLDALTAPHGLDRYLELVDPLLVRRTTRAVVTDVRRETADMTTLTLRPNRRVGHRAGQHVRVAVEIGGRRHVRCYSVSSSQHRDDGQLTITVKADPNGRVSPFLAHRAAPGLVVDLSEPDGEFTLPDPPPHRLLLLSGGSGITPVMSILRTLADQQAGTDVTFLHYARTADDVPYRDELDALHARGAARVVTVATRAPAPAGSVLTGHLNPAHVEALVGDPATVDAYVCGPGRLIDTARGLWADAGHEDRLHVERFQPAAAPDPDGDAVGTVAFTRAGTTVGNDGRTLLDQAEGAGLRPASGCRMGICHTCVRPKLAGRVRDVRDGRLTSEDPGDVQLCVSVPVGDVAIDL